MYHTSPRIQRDWQNALYLTCNQMYFKYKVWQRHELGLTRKWSVKAVEEPNSSYTLQRITKKLLAVNLKLTFGLDGSILYQFNPDLLKTFSTQIFNSVYCAK